MTVLWLIIVIIILVIMVGSLVILLTERRRSEEELSLKGLLLDSATDSIMLHDLDGNFIYLNEASYKSRGYEREEMLRMNVRQIDAKEDAEKLTERMATLEKEGEAKLEVAQLKKDGSILPVEIHSHIIEYNGKKLVLSIIRDVTERRKLEKARSELVNLVSHELRSPMATIREGLSQIWEGLRGPVTDDQKRIIDISIENIDRLARIVNDILDMSKFEAGKITLHKQLVDVVEVAREVAANYRAAAQRKGLEINEDMPLEKISVLADRDKLNEIFTNLLSNAIKFSEKGWIEIAVKDNPDDVECQVTDSGMGISRDDLPKLFTRFGGLKEGTQGGIGLGLGLIIVKSLVEIHGGTIRVE